MGAGKLSGRMLSISSPMKAGGLVNYYLGHEQADYYFDGIWQQGRSVGGAAEALGLAPEVQRSQFEHLLEGFAVDGHKPLVQNAGDPDRAAAWDLTFSAPKSVSVLWAMASLEVRAQIE